MGNISSLLDDMIAREMLISYELEVSATHMQEINGIAQVKIVVLPIFSSDYIQVIMNLE